MSAIIRLRPNRILLTPDEVRNLRPLRPNPSATPSPSAILAWDHNITQRRNRAKATRALRREALDLYAGETTNDSESSVKILEDARSSSCSSSSSSSKGTAQDGLLEDFIDIAYLADVDLDPPDSPSSEEVVSEVAGEYLGGAAAAFAGLEIASGSKTPVSLRRFAEREFASPGDGVSGLSPRHKAVERGRLARYRDRSGSGEGARLRRSRTAGGGFDGDDEGTDSSSEDEASSGGEDSEEEGKPGTEKGKGKAATKLFR